MMEYVLWKEVQAQLTKHREETGKPYSFYEAVKDLVDGGVRHTTEEPEELPLSVWAITDPEEFEAAFGEWAVDLEGFQAGFEQDAGPVEYTREVGSLDTAPVRIAWDQALGPHTHDAFEVGYMIHGAGQLSLSLSLLPKKEITFPCGRGRFTWWRPAPVTMYG